jgi:hypothetical protein
MNELIHAKYVHRAEPTGVMVVDIYKMDSPLAAYGIYSLQRPDDVEGVSLGTAGFWSEGFLGFVKDRIYVAIQPPGEGPRDFASAMMIGGYVDEQIRLSDWPLDMITAFPEQGRVKHSVKYLAANMLGHRFLGGGWLATYEYRGVDHTLFVVPCDSAAAALSRYEKLAAFVGKEGKILRRVKGIGRAALVATGKSIGRLFVTCSGKYLVGTNDCFDDERSIGLCREVLNNIARMGL